MRAPTELVSYIYRNPGAIHQFSMGDWDRLVRQARQSGLLARLHFQFLHHGLVASIPADARWHFQSAAVLAEEQQRELHRQLRQLRTLLAGLDFPLIVLKGAAYVAAGLHAAEGRFIDDIDLLIPGERLSAAESALMQADWQAADLPDYDRRYYRRWRHVSSSLQDSRRGTLLNLHHAILPDSARFRPDASKLRRRANELAGFPGLTVLAAEDLVLHAATQLFHDDALRHGLRDLSDLDLLLRQAATAADFWRRLLARAEEMELARPLFYALRYAHHLFATPIPDDVRDHLGSAAPGAATLRLMDGVYARMLTPDHHSCRDALSPLARQATYFRAHWLRRPPRQLIPHLFHKAFISPYQRAPKPA